MERCVLPAIATSIGDAFELSDADFRDLLHSSLVGRVAKINSAAQRTRIASGAKTLNLKRTAVWRDGGRLDWCVFKEDFCLEVRDKQSVAVFREAAASPGCIAARTRRGHGRIGFGVHFQDFLPFEVGHC